MKIPDELWPEMLRQAHRIRGHLQGQSPRTATLAAAAAIQVLNSSSEVHDESHLLALWNRVLRNVLTDMYRRKRPHVGESALEAVPDRTSADGRALRDELLASLSVALERLVAQHPDNAQIVSLRFDAGLTWDGIAQQLGIPSSTARSQWTFARAFLRAQVREQGHAPGEDDWPSLMPDLWQAELE